MINLEVQQVYFYVVLDSQSFEYCWA